MKRWAWEFLRRNPKYRQAWADYLHVCDSIIPGFNPLHPPSCQPEESNRLYGILESDEKYQVYDPPRQPGETENAWIARVGKGKITPLNVWHAEKWGLRSVMFDPDGEYKPFHADFKFTAYMVTTAGPGWDGFNEPMPRTKEAMIIDYSKPLGVQLEAIARRAKTHFDYLKSIDAVIPWPEKRGQDYRFYLRVLDALEEVGDADKVKFIGQEFYGSSGKSYGEMR